MFQTGEDFIAAFNVDGEQYKEVTQLTDTKFGFSVKRAYPEANKYVKQLKGVAPDVQPIAAFWVVLRPENEGADGKIPLTIRAADFTGYKGATTITPDEVHLPNKKIVRPMQVETNDDFFFCPQKNIFVNRTGTQRTPNEILAAVFNLHCNSVYFEKLPIFFIKRWLKEHVGKIAAKSVHVLDFVMEKGFGAELTKPEKYLAEWSSRQFAMPNQDKDQQTILGWKSHKSAIVSFCILLCIFMFLKSTFGWTSRYIHHVMSNNFLILIHVIVAFSLFELMPKLLLLPVRNALAKLRWWLAMSPTEMSGKLH